MTGAWNPRNIASHEAHLDQCWANLTATRQRVCMLVDQLRVIDATLPEPGESGAEGFYWIRRALSALRMELLVREMRRLNDEMLDAQEHT